MDEVEKWSERLKSKDDWTRWRAAIRLGEIKDKRAIPTLIDTLKDKDQRVRIEAASALSKIGVSDKQLEMIIRMLESEGSDERDGAARAISEFLIQCKTVQELENFEKRLDRYSTTLREGQIDKSIMINAQIKVAKLMGLIARKKDKLASKRDLLLDDKPKPPKKGRGTYQVSRRVRNG